MINRHRQSTKEKGTVPFLKGLIAASEAPFYGVPVPVPVPVSASVSASVSVSATAWVQWTAGAQTQATELFVD